MSYRILIEGSGETVTCGEGESVLEAMLRLGRRGIPVGCRGGGCGVCKVEVLAGDYTAEAMSRQHVSAEEQDQRHALACRIMPRSDLTVRVLGKMINAWTRG